MSDLGPWLDRMLELHDLAPPVVVGCSGGADSSALLALAQAAGLLPVAVHVDHGLREDSARDARTVEQTARALGARVRSVAVDIAAGGNLEARARAARRVALAGVADSLGASAILLGHTMDDQAETVLLHLLRGSAGPGLGAMAPRTDDPAIGPIVRPLLHLRRAETRALCESLGLEVVDDPMNDDLSYRRVWIRRTVLPLLAEGSGRDLVPVLARQARIQREESRFLDELAESCWPGERARARDLADLDVVLARRAVRRWLGPPPPRLDEVDAVLAVARGERRAVELAGSRRVWRRGGSMHHDAGAASRGYVVGA